MPEDQPRAKKGVTDLRADPAAVGEHQVVLASEILPDKLPLIPVENRPLFPQMIVPMVLDDEKARRVIADNTVANSAFFMFACPPHVGSINSRRSMFSAVRAARSHTSSRSPGNRHCSARLLH